MDTDYGNHFLENLKAINPTDSGVFLDWLFGLVLYKSTIQEQYFSADVYKEALLYLCERQGFELNCELFAYVMNTMYAGEFDNIFNELIEMENYEKCEKLKPYKDITEIPKLVNYKL